MQKRILICLTIWLNVMIIGFGHGITDYAIDYDSNEREVKTFDSEIAINLYPNNQSAFVNYGDDNWFDCFVNEGLELGILKDWKGDFKPKEKVLKAEAAKAIFLAANKLGLVEYNIDGDAFTDVPSSHPYFRYIQTLKEYGIADETGENYFEPNKLLNRAEVSKLICKTFITCLSEPIEYEHSDNIFNNEADFQATEWYYDYVMELFNTDARIQSCFFNEPQQIINGYPDGTFRPNNEINRDEFSKILMLAYNYYADKYGTTSCRNQSKFSNGDETGDIYETSSKTEQPESFTLTENGSIKMQIFPNPTSTEININLESIDKIDEGGKIQIFNITGQMLYEKTIDRLELGSFDIKVSSEMNFIKGIHLVIFTSESGVMITEKLIIE